jgi:hypothetical protein
MCERNIAVIAAEVELCRRRFGVVESRHLSAHCRSHGACPNWWLPVLPTWRRAKLTAAAVDVPRRAHDWRQPPDCEWLHDLTRTCSDLLDLVATNPISLSRVPKDDYSAARLG